MAKEDWIVTYREFSDSELAEEITRLDAQRKNFMVSQTAGSKSFSRDLSAINEQFTAAMFVKRERRLDSGIGSARVGTTDYSSLDIT
jgi:hypothetical protein